MKKLAIIVALDMNDAIGKGGTIPWHIPEDMKRFKELTMGRPVIMGRKTFESIGRALPGRSNIIVSRYPDAAMDRCEAANILIDNAKLKNGTEVVFAASFEIALNAAYLGYRQCEEPFVIGGAEIYRLAMPLATRLEWTQVMTRVEGADTFMPEASTLGDYESFDVTFGDVKEHQGLKYQFCTATRKGV